MKYLFSFILVFCLFACTTNSFKVVSNVSSGKPYESQLWEGKSEIVEVKNKRKNIPLDIQVLEKSDSSLVKGFELIGWQKENVLLEENQWLKITNKTPKCAKVKLTGTEISTKEVVKINMRATDNKIGFYLLNQSPKSIQLIIPNVMNPNLSPFSSSGVDLKINQEIFFKYRGRKYLLLKVSKSIKEGDKIKVNELLRERKKELGLN